MKRLRAAAIAFAVLAAAAAPARAQVLYGADGAEGNPETKLYILDPADGSVVSVVGPIGFAVTGMAFHPTTGVLYGSTSNRSPAAPRSLITIDLATGAGTLVGPFNVGPLNKDGQHVETMADIAFDPVSGELYGWLEPITDDLHRIDIATGQATRVGDSGLFTAGSGITVDGSGTILFAGTGDIGALHSIDPATGAPTVLASLSGPGPQFNSIGALAIDDAGTIFGARLGFDGLERTSDLITIDRATGQIATRGPTVRGLDAIAFQPVEELPPPQFTFGFLPPIDNLPAVNWVRAGQSVPIRFVLEHDYGPDAVADGYPKAPALACAPGAPVDASDEVASTNGAGTTFHQASGTYVFVWRTPKAWANTCRELVVRLNDGSVGRALFNFTR